MARTAIGLPSRAVLLFVPLALAVSGVPRARAIRALTDQTPVVGAYAAGSLDDSGSFVFADSNANPAGGDPLSAPQAMRWDTATGQVTQLTALGDGVVAGTTAVSDDGAWVAFLSTSNPLGTNADRSVELFVMRTDGTRLDQLTDVPDPDDGTIHRLSFAGSGNRVVLVSDADLLGANPLRVAQVFVLDRDGSQAVQVSAHVADDPLAETSISDDGVRIVYSHAGAPGAGNPEGNREIFAVLHDGTGERAITAATAGESASPALSGNGERIVFASTADLTGQNPLGLPAIVTVDWAGTGMTQITGGPGNDSSSFTPAITDDGSTIVYASDEAVAGNTGLDRNVEIFAIGSDATGKTLLTDTPLGVRIAAPVVSGDGSRILFRIDGPFPGGLNADGGEAWLTLDGGGGDARAVVELEHHVHLDAVITPDGARVGFLADAYDAVANPDRLVQVFRVDTDGSDPVQVTRFVDGDALRLGGISADGSMLAFSADADPLGCNGIHNAQVMIVENDGAVLLQPASCPASGSSDGPSIPADGSFVVFQSDEDLAQGNSDGSAELFRRKLSGGGPPIRRLTSDDDDSVKRPRASSAGGWVVFQSSPAGPSQVFRVEADGSSLEPLTFDPTHPAVWPDVSASGERIVYSSSADPLGTNPEHNGEIFLLEPSTGTLTQLTRTVAGDSSRPCISGDGAWVYFTSDAPFFEAFPDAAVEPYRVDVATGTVQRAGGLRWTGGEVATIPPDSRIEPVADGDRAVFVGWGDRTGTNPDGSSEVFLVDFGGPASIFVGKDSPTVVSWTAEPSPVRYDVIRGNVDALQWNLDGTVDLGAVVCVENDSRDNDTVGDEDAEDPLSGQAFFFLRRGSQGVGDVSVSWGRANGGGERVAGAGACDP